MMPPSKLAVRFWRGVAASVCVAVTSFTAMRAPQDPSSRPTAPWPRSGAYVGPAECARCHDDEAAAIGEGAHAAVVTSAATMGCETCHGPGGLHVVDPGTATRRITHPAHLPPATQSALCGRCHAPEARGHGGGGAAAFVAAGLGCTACHFVHEARSPAPMPGVRFTSRAATLAGAEPVGNAKCVTCHRVQATALGTTGHAALAGQADGCATCHGNGSRHTVTGGIGRLISRPDRATDGVATCVACHTDVDPERAHWPGADPAFLGDARSCFTCHTVHGGARRVAPDTAAIVATNRACVTCHARAFTAHVARDSVHGPMTEPDAPLAAGCGGCHAGAAEHAAAGGVAAHVTSLRVPGTTAAVVDATCRACHGRDATLHAAERGDHARAGLACTTCHAVSPARGAVRDDAERRCATCHRDVEASFRLPNRHPVALGAGPRPVGIGCSDCHDAHTARRRLRDPVLREDVCVTCHRAYRGPFVFEHQASRLDGCIACHVPHGSTNRRLLHEANTQQNCTACHADYPAFHDQSTGSVFTNCLNCHTQIHGSNHSRFFLR